LKTSDSTNKNQKESGLSRSYDKKTRRIINKNGSFNVKKIGVRKHIFQTLVGMSIPQFLLWSSLFYLLLNLIFALIYLILGTEHLYFAGTADSFPPFLKAFYFSMQTFTTVGFGSIYPEDSATNFVSGMEAMLGWMFFAVATGLIYTRFSKPSARIIFSDNALISPYEADRAFMFRVVNGRPNVLMEMKATVILAIDTDESEAVKRMFYNLDLETKSITFFPLSWTIVHPLTDGSPMSSYTSTDLKRLNAEFLILIKGYDETFGQNIHLRFSYTADEIIDNAKFKKNFKANDDGIIELDVEGVHSYTKL